MVAWYAVKSLYRTDVVPPKTTAPRLSSFEERIVLVRAGSFDEALQKGEAEARQYTDDNGWFNAGGEKVRTRYLEALDAFSLSGEVADGEEVYSKILFVTPDVADEELVNRGLGQESEQRSPDAACFEPDFERVARGDRPSSQGGDD
jgi:hypothetical protein